MSDEPAQTTTAAGIRPLDLEQLSPELQELLAARVRRLGYLGDFFRYMGHQPEGLTHFVRFSEEVKDSLPWRLVEIVALTISSRAGNAYEQVQHERLAAKLGMPEVAIAQLTSGAPRPEHFSQAELTVAALARSMHDDGGRGSGPHVEALVALTDESTATGCLLACGRYVAHSAIANALGLRAPAAVGGG